MTKDKERDDALIAEAISGFPGNAFTAQMLAQAVLRLERSGWQPKPDRAEVLFDDLYGKTKDEQIDCFRRHFAELRAEWEAERPVIEVPIQVKAWAEGIGSVIPPTDEVREWIKSLPIGATVRPAVPVFSEEVIKQMVTRFLGWKLPDDFHPDDGISFEPEFNKEWNASQGKPPQRHTPTGTNLFNYTQAEAMVRYILDGAKGGE